MHVFFCGCFSGRSSTGMAHFKPLKGENARQVFVGCLPTAMSDYKPVKEGETLVNLLRVLFGSFSVPN